MKWRVEKHADEWWIRIKYNMFQLRETEIVMVEVEDLLYAGSNKKDENKMAKLFRKIYGKEVQE